MNIIEEERTGKKIGGDLHIFPRNSFPLSKSYRFCSALVPSNSKRRWKEKILKVI